MEGEDGTEDLGTYLPVAIADGLGFVDRQDGEDVTADVRLTPQSDHLILTPTWDPDE